MNWGEIRSLFPATERLAYFNSAAVGLGSIRLRTALEVFQRDWFENGFDYVRAEEAAESARRDVARLIGADPQDIALIPGVSAAAGLIAAQFTHAAEDENIVIGAEEYSSNHFPWRQLAWRGYEIRMVPFCKGGISAKEISRRSDGGTRIIAVSAVQAASGHRSDIPGIAEIAHGCGARLFVDASQSVGAMDVSGDVAVADFMAFSNHKYLLNAGRGMGYLYIRRDQRDRLLPFGAGWRAGAEPFHSFFGPEMRLSPDAARFDSAISWLAAVGDVACLGLVHEIGPDRIYGRCQALSVQLRHRLTEIGCAPLDPGTAHRSHIIALDLPEPDIVAQLGSRGIIAAARNGKLRLSLSFMNDESDIDRLVDALRDLV